jgi:glucose-1-phosphate cytidylyltransferase
MPLKPKVVILAGGRGTRLAEETESKPKPMVEVGDRPILWHIMKIYASQGFTDFCIALGYKGHLIKRYFLDEVHLTGDLTIETGKGHVISRRDAEESWTIHLQDTGMETSTGGRLKRLAPLLGEGTFLLTYGDGVADVPVDEVLAFHKKHGRLATLTAVRPPARFGGVVFDGDMVKEFAEKPQIGEGWINGGFIVFESAVLDMISGDSASLESQLLEKLASENQLAAYRHEGFWQCMDTVRDRQLLQALWDSGNPPWKIWE